MRSFHLYPSDTEDEKQPGKDIPDISSGAVPNDTDNNKEKQKKRTRSLTIKVAKLTPAGLTITERLVAVNKKNGWTVFDLKKELSTMIKIPFKTMEVGYVKEKKGNMTCVLLGPISEPLVSFSQHIKEYAIVFDRCSNPHTTEINMIPEPSKAGSSTDPVSSTAGSSTDPMPSTTGSSTDPASKPAIASAHDVLMSSLGTFLETAMTTMDIPKASVSDLELPY
jgi:hypothetical protein